MNKLTEEKIKANSHIPSEEVQRDIKDTQDEIIQYEKELEVLSEDPQRNRLEIYMREGGIAKRKRFIDNLKSILEYRNSKPNEP